MKRAVQPKPLKLATETLKTLDQTDLTKVAGGRDPSNSVRPGGTC